VEAVANNPSYTVPEKYIDAAKQLVHFRSSTFTRRIAMGSLKIAMDSLKARRFIQGKLQLGTPRDASAIAGIREDVASSSNDFLSYVFFISGTNDATVKKFIDELSNEYGRLTVKRPENGKLQYLGMVLDFSKKGEVRVTMEKYQNEKAETATAIHSRYCTQRYRT
jgi:hypothetical protein